MRIRTTTGPSASPLFGPDETSVAPNAVTAFGTVGGGR
jgi:hypothetical protein